MAGLIRVVIADDEPIYRAGLHRVVEADPMCRVVGEAGDARETLSLIEAFRPDVLLLGSVGPSRLLAAMRDRSPGVRSVLLVRRLERGSLMQARRLGARGILLRTSPAPVLLRCVRAVAAGRTWIGRGDEAELDRPHERRVPADLVVTAGLTHRELEVVSVIVEGASNKDIALLFSISENTVKHHLTRIFDKVGVSSRLELAVRAATAPSSPEATRRAG